MLASFDVQANKAAAVVEARYSLFGHWSRKDGGVEHEWRLTAKDEKTENRQQSFNCTVVGKNNEPENCVRVWVV